MKYWDAILKEVLDKENYTGEVSFTNIKDYRDSANKKKERKSKPRIKKIKPVKPRQSHKKYYLGNLYPGVYFTQRETQTIYFLLRGNTIVEVAEILGLSRRTIEFYLKNMKSKLNCHSKSELISKVLQTDLFAQLDESVSGALEKLYKLKFACLS